MPVYLLLILVQLQCHGGRVKTPSILGGSVHYHVLTQSEGLVVSVLVGGVGRGACHGCHVTVCKAQR